jgi:hypothetical protein
MCLGDFLIKQNLFLFKKIMPWGKRKLISFSS